METITISLKGLKKLLYSNYLSVNKALLKLVGQDAAIWFADVFSKFEYFEKNGMLESDGSFFNTQKNIENDTCLSPFHQSAVVKKLSEMNIIQVKKRGLPSKNYYLINFEVLFELLANLEENNQSFGGTMTNDCYSNVNNNIKGNNIKLNNTCSREQVIHFDNQSDLTGSIKSTLIDKGKAKAKTKDIVVDKPLNGPFKKIFNYWQLSGLRSPKTNTKIYEKNVIALRSLLREYSVNEIVKAIDLLKLAISPGYTPASLKAKEYYKTIYFADFVFNERINKSLFKELLDNPPKPLQETVKPIPDPDPEITNYLLNSYQQKAMGHANVDFLKDEKNKNTFRLANLYLQKFWKANLQNFSYGEGTNTLAKHLINAFESIVEDEHNGDTTKWKLWWFRKEDFIFDTLSKYLYNQSLMR